jgi:hypothetical protein
VKTDSSLGVVQPCGLVVGAHLIAPVTCSQRIERAAGDGVIDDQKRSGPDEMQDASRGDCAYFKGPYPTLFTLVTDKPQLMPDFLYPC